MPNLFTIPNGPISEELVDLLACGDGLRIERIISLGHVSPPDFWYDQEQDEWVALVQGEAEIRFTDGKTKTLKAGDYLFLPAGLRHRVERTSNDPPCIWLAVHGRMTDTARP
jgi:cupin 2 domain-containing protein